MDINGDSDPELIVPFGKRLYLWRGRTRQKSQMDGHHLWACQIAGSAPAVADMDNDEH